MDGLDIKRSGGLPAQEEDRRTMNNSIKLATIPFYNRVLFIAVVMESTALRRCRELDLKIKLREREGKRLQCVEGSAKVDMVKVCLDLGHLKDNTTLTVDQLRILGRLDAATPLEVETELCRSADTVIRRLGRE